ncbi:four helix bundle protein [Algoriphagus ornithinivorans]|uniref:Four helix bundle protein n=1 Tax=Algoriphagus ornithinivorans TaxID=226506 RepID=A0A1I5JPW6_9BACT|nr:four helix bundle protein [Algoriphagus ornithinivorans]SFO74451.1 four helix bundle protein [Algoriphagus ornithinivorans]
MKIARFEDLEIWKEARELCLVIRRMTRKNDFSRDFKLSSQITSSSGSIMDNVAEGFDRDGNKEFIQFLSIARGSNAETRSQGYRAFDYEYISKEELEEILERTERLRSKINSLIIYLRNSDKRGNKFS